MYIEEKKIEEVHIEAQVIVVGPNLQKSGLPINFDSLGKMWEGYTEEMKLETPKRSPNQVEYGICLNKVPDYIVGVEVLEEITDLKETYYQYTIPSGDYVKASFNAENYASLVEDKLMKMLKEAKKWAKQNKIKLNNEYTVEVYPKEMVEKEYPEMYILLPINK